MRDFERAWDRDRATVLAFLVRQTRGDTELAEDLLQTASIRAFKAWEGYDGRAKFSSWLNAIAMNVYRDHLRAKRRRPDTVSLDAPLDDDGRAFDPPSENLPLDDILADIVCVADFERRLRNLPEKYSTVLVHVLEAAEYDDVAARLGIPVGTVRSRLYRARAMMRKSIIKTPLGKMARQRATCYGGDKKRGCNRTGSRNGKTARLWDDVVRLYLAGDSLRTIRAKTSLSLNTIKSIKKQAALPKRTTAYRSSREAAARPNIRGGGRPRTREEMQATAQET